MSTFHDTDLCTDLILDFIAGGVPGNPSGESRGDYEILIGNAHAPEPLANYSLDDIYKVMDWLIDELGEPSTAVGRYQIIRKTMQALQASKQLPGTTRFTHEVQDQLALALMVQRGYSSWWVGHITDAEFAHGISCEWASLPDPQKSGRSHYDGVGANHAGTTLAAVYDMLRRARAVKPTK